MTNRLPATPAPACAHLNQVSIMPYLDRFTCLWCGVLATGKAEKVSFYTTIQPPPGWLVVFDCSELVGYACSAEHAQNFGNQ